MIVLHACADKLQQCPDNVYDNLYIVKVDMPQSLWKWPNGTNSTLSTPVPDSSSSADFNTQSGCTGGGNEKLGWSCPHLMLLSPDMQLAAQADGNTWAVYGVAGVGNTNDCGSCYQLEITGTNGSPMPSPNKYIVQGVNTGGDLSNAQFDILLGAGGFGIFDACSSDCHTRSCSTNCNAPQFTGGFSAWTPDNNCYGGGVHSADDCSKLTSTNSFADATLLYGCPTAITRNYHVNFQVQWARVQCPESLYKVVGIRRKDDTNYPLPQPNMQLSQRGRTTTTMDCCKPTCAWRQNVESFTDPTFPQVYNCNKEGMPN